MNIFINNCSFYELMETETIRDTSMKGLKDHYTKDVKTIAKKTKAEITAIVKKVKASFSEEKTTNKGHAKYVRFTVDGVSYAYKPDKPLMVEPEQYAKVEIGVLSSEFMEQFNDNIETIRALDDQLGTKSAKPTASEDLTF